MSENPTSATRGTGQGRGRGGRGRGRGPGNRGGRGRGGRGRGQPLGSSVPQAPDDANIQHLSTPPSGHPSSTRQTARYSGPPRGTSRGRGVRGRGGSGEDSGNPSSHTTPAGGGESVPSTRMKQTARYTGPPRGNGKGRRRGGRGGVALHGNRRGAAEHEVEASAVAYTGPVIDQGGFPDILADILGYAPRESLVALRAASTEWRMRADALLFERIVVHIEQQTNKITITSPGGGRLPLVAAANVNPTAQGGDDTDSDDSDGRGAARLEPLMASLGLMSETEMISRMGWAAMQAEDPDLPDYDDDSDEDLSDDDIYGYSNHGYSVRSSRTSTSKPNPLLIDQQALAHVRVLDIDAGYLKASTMKQLRDALPNVHTLRTTRSYEADVRDPYPLIAFPGVTHVIFTRPERTSLPMRGQVNCIPLPCVPKGVTKCVVNVSCNHADANTWISPEGYAYPSTLKEFVFIFTTMDTPLGVDIGATADAYPTLMLYHLLGDMLENIPRVRYTFVDLLELSPAAFGLDRNATSSQVETAIRSALTARTVDYSHGPAWGQDVTNHVTFLTKAEYRARVGEATFGVETEE